ncbi:MAG: dTDP-4-dehydrorhamnose reductase [Legionellales bacterium]|nr:dTDP-4-dehydrorhamnose reductase [Legionellales bacterium]OUX66229.1 MAG: dTDP-4-dehydrorhamnose reductase [Gammaproteobacteria bacterium TMED281]
MILVFGKTGQVATELQNSGDVLALGREQADFSDPRACENKIRSLAPHVVINAAAYTAVDKAEANEKFATVINGDTPTILAQVCAEMKIPIVHISSDYVFDGSGKSAWKPGDATSPQNAYGRSKLAGEKGILGSGANYVILRTSWVISSHGTNFVKSMLHLSETKDKLTVVEDQIGGPTPAQDIAQVCMMIAKQLLVNPSKSGIYHYCGTPNISWAGLASEIFLQANRPTVVAPIQSDCYTRSTKRPLNSRMDCSLTNKIFGIKQPNWRMGLNKILKELEVIV